MPARSITEPTSGLVAVSGTDAAGVSPVGGLAGASAFRFSSAAAFTDSFTTAGGGGIAPYTDG